MPWLVLVCDIAQNEMRHGRHGPVQALVIQDAEPPLLSGHLNLLRLLAYLSYNTSLHGGRACPVHTRSDHGHGP